MRTSTGIASIVLILLLAFALLALDTGNAVAQKYLPTQDFVKAAVVPEPVLLEWRTREAFPLIATTVIVVPSTSSREELEAAGWLKMGLHNLYGISPEIMLTDLVPERNAIVMGTLESSPSLGNLVLDMSREQFGRFPEQGYALSMNPHRVVLVGVSVKGLQYGVQTLLQLVTMEVYIHKFVVPPVEIADFPAHGMRGFLLPLRDYRHLMHMLDARRLIDTAEMLHMNTLIIQVDNAIKYDSAPEVSRSGALEKDSLRAIVQYGREAGMDVIPMVNTFSHQDLLLCRAYPELCIDKETYDPSNPEVYEKLFGILDEILEICEPARVHVGHDWIRALGRFSEDEAGELFLSDVRKIHGYLREKNVEMMMWADMLLDPDVCGLQDNCHGWLGNTCAVIDSLPKDIIMMEAHSRYGKSEFPSSDYLLSKGFRVVGCVSKDARVTNDFSKYTAGRNDRFLGMVVALWGCFEYRSLYPSTPRRTLREAAEAFWRGGVPPVDPMGEKKPRSLKDRRH